MSNYFATYAEDLEQDPFDAEDFVERLAWRLTGGGDEKIDPIDLHRQFEQEIANLQMLSDQYQGKIQSLQNQCREEEEEFNTTLQRLADENGKSLGKLKTLDGNINNVAAKVVHLGDQLQSVNSPRARAQEAFTLMQYFNEFLSDQPLDSDVFLDPFRLLEAADVINKLYLISTELPEDKFSAVQRRIADQYETIEKELLEKFEKTYRMGHMNKLKQITEILSHFKGYSRCINTFVEYVQIGEFRSPDIFRDILALCKKTEPVIKDIFPDSDQVMAKLVLNIFHGRLQETLTSKLSDCGDKETYLSNLYELYSKTQKLAGELEENVKVGSDKDYVPALIRALFAKYVDPYMGYEKKYLRDQLASLLHRFYESKSHQKRQLPASGFGEMGRDIRNRVLNPESFGGESFISEEVAINILQETKLAFQRANILSAPGDEGVNMRTILDILLQYLFTEHLEYAAELGANTIPLSEPKTPPSMGFLNTVRQTAAITHLFEKQFEDSILPFIKLLNAAINYIRVILGDQKKTDFKPENDEAVMPLCSVTSSNVCSFTGKVVLKISDSLDGDNLRTILGEFGLRFHRIILDHIYSYQYSSTGAMILLCDINEYRRCLTEVIKRSTLVGRLFETLHALCNLLVVQVENLQDATTAELLGDVDRTIIVNFVQLRSDHKSARLMNEFR